MKYRAMPIIITVIIAIVGFLIKRKTCSNLQKRLDMTIRFQNILADLADHFFSHGDFNTKAYNEYMDLADAMQVELGADGIIAFIDPLKNVQHNRYQLILNLVPELRSLGCMVRSNSIIAGRLNQLVGTTDDALRRHAGKLKIIREREIRESHNPFICFAEGIRTILRLPGNILVWLGLVGRNTEQKLHTGMIFKVVGWIGTLVGFISAVMTIVLGWDQCLGMVKKLMERCQNF